MGLFDFFKKSEKKKIVSAPIFIDPLDSYLNKEEDYIVIANTLDSLPIEFRDRVITKWLVKEGDSVYKGQDLFKVKSKNTYGITSTFGIKAPSTSKVIKIIPQNTVLEYNQKCCILKEMSSKEIANYIYDFDVEYESESSTDTGTRIYYKEGRELSNTIKSYVDISQDDFSGEITVETKSIKSLSFDYNKKIRLSLLKKKHKFFLIIKTYKKHCKLSQSTVFYISFADNVKFKFKMEFNGKRFGKDSDGVIFTNKVTLTKQQIAKFSHTPFNKWKIENASEDIEITGGITDSYYKEFDYHKRELLTLAKAFDKSTND